VRSKKMLARALGVESSVCGEVEELEGEPGFVVKIRLRASDESRCPMCQVVCPGYDQADRVRRWRTHPLGLGKTYVAAPVPRVRCPEHGILVAHVPWARPSAKFTASFEDMVAWQAVRMDRSAVNALNAIAWRTVGAILGRVGDAMKAKAPPLTNITRIGIDEVSYRKGHRYLTIVVDHDTGRLLWAHPGHDKATLKKFFRMLGRERCKQIRLVSADAAPWIAAVVDKACPNAKRCMDPFHVVQWAGACQWV
jgi:transposase